MLEFIMIKDLTIVETDRLAKILWDYHHVNHEIKPAEIIIGFTSLDLSVPEYVAALYKQNYAPLVLFAGDNAVNHQISNDKNVQRTDWGMSEAEKFAEVAKENGVPEDAILVESRSTNSELNVRYSYDLLKKREEQGKGRVPHDIILVQKPSMERRAFATFMNFWPEKDVNLMVTSPQISYEESISKYVDRDTIINIMVGDLQRIKIYPEKGFQIPQEIPEEVWDAYEQLVAAGFNKHLVN